MDAQLVEQCQVQIRHRRVFRIREVTTSANSGGGAANQQNGEVLIQVHVAVAQRAAVHQQRMIEQRAVALGDRPKPVEEVAVQLGVEGVDLQDLRDLVGVALVMRQ